MNRVDHILSFLSGEMEADERRDFQKDLERDEALKLEFDRVSAAWKLVRDELRERDEAAFQAALHKAMTGAPDDEGIGTRKKRLWWFLIPLAASLAILLATPLLKHTESAFLRYYHPDRDGIVRALCQESRASGGTMATLYSLEAYGDCFSLATKKLEQDSDDQLARLFLYLAGLESGQEALALEIGGYPAETSSSLDQSVIWYRTLLLVKCGDHQKALAEACRLSGTESPYAGDAYKLKRMLRK